MPGWVEMISIARCTTQRSCALSDFLYALDSFKNIVNDVLDIARHQKTRRAVPSISALSIG